MISTVFPVARKNIERNRRTSQTNKRLQIALKKLWGFWPWDGLYCSRSTVASWDAPFSEGKKRVFG